MTHKISMSHEELYFRILIALFGVAITTGAFIIGADTLLRLLQIAGGVITTTILFIWRLKK